MPSPKPATDVERLRADNERLAAEVAHLRGLVGPSEESYVKLRVDLLGARDAAIGAEAEAGRLKAYCLALEAQTVRMQRDHEWLRDQVILRLKRLRHSRPTFDRVVGRLSR
jgi:hypothetical protein